MSRVMGEEVENQSADLAVQLEAAAACLLRHCYKGHAEAVSRAAAALQRLQGERDEARAHMEAHHATSCQIAAYRDQLEAELEAAEAQVEAMRKALERIRAKRDPLAMDVRWAVLDEIHEIVDAALSAPAEERSSGASRDPSHTAGSALDELIERLDDMRGAEFAKQTVALRAQASHEEADAPSCAARAWHEAEDARANANTLTEAISHLRRVASSQLESSARPDCTHPICSLKAGDCARAGGRTEPFEDCPSHG